MGTRSHVYSRAPFTPFGDAPSRLPAQYLFWPAGFVLFLTVVFVLPRRSPAMSLFHPWIVPLDCGLQSSILCSAATARTILRAVLCAVFVSRWVGIVFAADHLPAVFRRDIFERYWQFVLDRTLLPCF